MAQSVKNPPAMQDLGSIPELGRSPVTGDNYPLQYSGLENSMDYTVHGVTKIQAQLSNFYFHKPVVGLLSIIDCLSDLVSDTESLLPQTHFYFWNLPNIVLLLLLSRFSCVWLCSTPETAAHQAPPSLGFSRQEYWSGLPFLLEYLFLPLCYVFLIILLLNLTSS